MEGRHKKTQGDYSPAMLWTTILACLWGAAASYILFDSLLITHHARFALAAIVPLVAGWATLEGKRWGRLALMGLSLTTVAVFVSMLGLFAAFRSQWQPEVQTIDTCIRSLMAAYGVSTTVATGLLTLAAITSLSLCHPKVAAEFNKNKRVALVGAQRGIATILVGCWGAAIALTPMPPSGKHKGVADSYARYASPRVRNLHAPLAPTYLGHVIINRATRSAVSDTNR